MGFTHRVFVVATLLGLNFLAIVSAEDFLKDQPSYLQPCKIYEPGFTQCSTKSIQNLFTQLANGIPGLRSVGTFDPFRIKKIVYKQDNNQVATITANLTDLVVKGFANTIVKESKVSKKDFSWETKLLIPKMRMDGKYKMDGKILAVALKGSGKMFIETENMDVTMFTKTRLYEKGGFTFYNVTSIRIQLSISKLRTRFENLFNGNKELENSTNEFFNSNWPDFFEALRPVLTQTIQDILLQYLQSVFHFIPANFFVSDIPTSKQLYGNS